MTHLKEIFQIGETGTFNMKERIMEHIIFKLFFAIAIIGMPVSACNKMSEMSLSGENEGVTTDTVIELSLADTKALISDSGSGAASFSWESGDEIGVVASGALRKFTLTSFNGGTARFTASLPVGVTIEDNADIAYPYYPDDYSAGVFSLSFPESYTSSASNSFRHRWSGKLSKGGEGKYTATLTHQTGIVRVTYKDVSHEANAVTLTADKAIAGASNTVTVEFSWHTDGEMSFYFPVPAGNYTSFSTELFNGSDAIPGTHRTLSGSTMTIKEGYIYRLPAIQPLRVLVAYFSFTNNTKGFAQRLGALSGGNLYEITPTEAYGADNNNYYDTGTRAYKEQYGPVSARPSIVTDLASVDEYDVLLLGFPIWYGKAPRVVFSFLDTYDFSSKKVIPFITSGSSGISSAQSELESTYPAISWLSGSRLDEMSDSALTTWLQSYGIGTQEASAGIKVTIGHTTFAGKPADNPSAKAFEALLPLTLSMTELNGNEKYHYLSSSLPSSPACPGIIEKGDLWLYGDKCVVLFYDSFSTVYSYTRLGKLTNPAGLETVVGAGSINVQFANNE